MMIVDSQVHIWAADTPERPWPPGEAARAHQPTPLTAEGLLEKMDAAGVARAILVPPSWEGDRNDVVLAAAHRYPERFAVMGRISLEAPESREEFLPLTRTDGMPACGSPSIRKSSRSSSRAVPPIGSGPRLPPREFP